MAFKNIFYLVRNSFERKCYKGKLRRSYDSQHQHNDNQHYHKTRHSVQWRSAIDIIMLSVIMVSVIILNVPNMAILLTVVMLRVVTSTFTWYCYAECHYAGCRKNPNILNVVYLSFVTLTQTTMRNYAECKKTLAYLARPNFPSNIFLTLTTIGQKDQSSFEKLFCKSIFTKYFLPSKLLN